MCLISFAPGGSNFRADPQAQFWKTYATWIASENDEAELQLILAGRATHKRQGKVDE